jgi:hypothetical protein
VFVVVDPGCVVLVVVVVVVDIGGSGDGGSGGDGGRINGGAAACEVFFGADGGGAAYVGCLGRKKLRIEDCPLALEEGSDICSVRWAREQRVSCPAMSWVVKDEERSRANMSGY